MNRSHDKSSAEHWKRKYTEELDRLENEWRATEAVLGSAVTRLSVLAGGRDPALDDVVRQIRESVADGVDAARLNKLLQRLSTTLIATDPVPESGAAVAARGESGTACDGGGLPAHRSHEADIPHAANTDDGFHRRREAAASVVDRIARGIGATGAIAEVRDRIATAVDDAGLCAVLDECAGLFVRATDSAQTGSAEAGPSGGTQGAVNDEGAITGPALLLQLIEQISVPPGFEEAIESMKARLGCARGDHDWRPLLVEVAGLVNRMSATLQQQKEDLSRFLQHVGGRLDSLTGMLGRERNALRDRITCGTRFSDGMNDQIRCMRGDVTAAVDLEAVKSTVEHRLVRMSDQLVEHREAEERCLQEARQRIEQMQARVADLEEESSQLRETIQRKGEEALTDAVTGIPNRRAWDERIAGEFQRWQRHGTPLTLALLDLDHFSLINNDYGHQAGDKALRVIARLLERRLRRIDFVARFGGDEFVVLFPGTRPEAARVAVESLRARVESSGFHHKGEPVAITLSAGICGFESDDTIESVLERADQALYESKKNRRNRCTLARSGTTMDLEEN